MIVISWPFLAPPHELSRHWRPWLFGVLAFAGVGIMRWPLVWVMGALAPWAVFAAWKEQE